MKKSKVLITGSGGFIGSALCRRFMAWAEVIALDVCKKPDNLPKRLIWAQVDIAILFSGGGVPPAQSDVIIHCAGLAHQKAGTVAPRTISE